MILLAFDDHHLKAWTNLIPWMEMQNIKATFYLSGADKYSIDDWSMVTTLNSVGHAIGYHTLNHVDLWTCSDILNWFNEEILNGIKIFRDKGFHVRHFAYPYGRDAHEANRLISSLFDTVRGVTLAAYPTIKEFPNYWGAWELDRSETWKMLEESPVEHIKGVLQHDPNHDALGRLANIARNRGEQFVNIEQVWRRRNAI